VCLARWCISAKRIKTSNHTNAWLLRDS